MNWVGMTAYFVGSQFFRILVILVISLSTVIALGGSTQSQEADQPTPLDEMRENVHDIWEVTDGPISRGESARAWVWGPEPLASSTETYPGSPDGLRRFVYYDKGRLDIRDLGRDADDPWYAVGGLLVSEMLAGHIQLGTDRYVDYNTPEIPITGDIDQPDPVTYASLAPYSTVRHPEALNKQQLAALADVTEPGDRSGQRITTLLEADGDLAPEAENSYEVTLGDFDSVTELNIAQPFADWVSNQQLSRLYLLGRPITAPYWIDTVENGEPARVLIQAFERRIMMYTPEGREGWQIEFANIGRHYRDWRALPEMNDLALIPLGRAEPFAEEMIGAALGAQVDPFMLVAMSNVASGGDPFAASVNEGRGLLAVQPQVDGQDERENLETPALNAQHAASDLRSWIPEGDEFDWRAVLANYYHQGQPNWDDPELDAFVHGVLEEYGRLKESYPPLVERELLEVDLETFGGVLSTGPAAYYDPSYDVAWWEKTLLYYERIGLIKPGWEPDPDGYYCVRPGYIPGHRLRLTANGVTITCTIGDMVADHDLHGWLNISGWAVEMSWPTFKALGLDGNNRVQVEYPDAVPHANPPIPPPTAQAPDPTPPPADPSPTTPAVEPSPSVASSPTPEPTTSPTATATDEPSEPSPTETEAPTEPPPPTETEAPTEPPATPTAEPPSDPTATAAP